MQKTRSANQSSDNCACERQNRTLIPPYVGFWFRCSPNPYSKFVWEKYRALTPTCRRLFDYCASHRQPYPLALDKFQMMCGSDTNRAAKWKEQSKAACYELKKSELVTDAYVNGDFIYLKRG